jgi:hypothetical protein
MYGVPVDLPLERFIGDALFQICIGRDGLHFVFGRSGTISVGGRWELTNASGTMIDCSCETGEREAYRVHTILNQDVANSRIDPPHSFSLTFSKGHRLTVFDDSQQFESCAIEPGGFIV